MRARRKFLAISFTAVIAACGPIPPPVVTPQPPPAPVPLPVHVVIRDAAGKTPEHIRGTIGAIACTPLSFAMLSCDLAPGVSYGTTVSVVFEGDGSDPFRGELAAAADLNVILPASFHPLPPLTPRGRVWFTADGQPFDGPAATEFNLLARFVHEGPDAVEPVGAQLEAEGYRYWRVFTAFDICPTVGPGCTQPIGRLLPSADVYVRIPAFLRFAAKHRAYVELVAFTGPYGSTFANEAAKVAHWTALQNAVAGETNALLELVNEGDHPANVDIPFPLLSRPPPSLLAAHGSGTQDADPVQPTWGYVTWHPASGEFQRKAGHNGWEVALKYNAAVVVNEMIRAPDQDANPDHFFDAGAGCKLFGVICTLHSVHGKAGQLWDADELAAARALKRGVNSIPAYCQTGQYLHPSDGPFLRVYEMTGVGPGCRVEIRP